MKTVLKGMQMMEIILIDDEPLALELLSNVLSKRGDYKIIGKYTDPVNLLEEKNELEPDVIISDLDGRELEMKANTSIIFVTGYKDYALEAFKANGVDYLLKPVEKESLDRAFERVTKMLVTTKRDNNVMISCFGSLNFIDETTKQHINVKWRTLIAKELFSLLLTNRGEKIRKDAIIEYFWPGSPHQKAYAQLYSTIYNIRKILEKLNIPILIESTDLNYKLELNGVRLDVDEWERALNETSDINEMNYEEKRKILSMYMGQYLDEEEYGWAENERERLRMIWLHYVRKIADYLKREKLYTEAILFYLEIQRTDPLIEENYFQLMRLYDLTGDRGAVIAQFNKLTKMLETEYGIKPSKKVVEWYGDLSYHPPLP